MNKKITVLILVICLIITNIVAFGDIAISEDEFLTNQDESLMQINLFLSKYNDNGIYPDYYADSYIDKYGKLVILVTDDSKEIIQEIQDVTNNSDIQIRKVKYSLNDMNSAMDEIVSAIENIKTREPILSSIGINVYNNEINLKLFQSIEEVNVLSRDTTSDMINITYVDFPTKSEIELENLNAKAEVGLTGEVQNRYSVPLKAGQYINNNSTLTFCATKNGKTGFVMSAHSTDGYNSNVVLGPNVVGKVKLNVPTGIDAAWVEITNSNYYITNSLVPSYSIQGSGSFYYPVGTLVYGTGKSSGRQSTTIKEYNASYFNPYINSLLIDVIILEKPFTNGDSGGPVTVRVQGYELIFGMISVKDNNDTYCTKFTKIIQGLGVSPKTN